MTTQIIFAYHREIGNSQSKALMSLWRDRWAAEGWIPVIYGPQHGCLSPRWDEMQRKIDRFPCATHKEFERSNFERWVAFAQIRSRGSDAVAVADYDVFPIRPFPPKEFGPLPVCGDKSGGPGFIVGTGEDFGRIVDEILSYEVEPDDKWQGQPHICDMRILRKRAQKLYRIEPIVATYGTPEFGTVPLAHFGNASLDEMTGCFSGMTKTEAIKRLQAEYYGET